MLKAKPKKLNIQAYDEIISGCLQVPQQQEGILWPHVYSVRLRHKSPRGLPRLEKLLCLTIERVSRDWTTHVVTIKAV